MRTGRSRGIATGDVSGRGRVVPERGSPERVTRRGAATERIVLECRSARRTRSGPADVARGDARAADGASACAEERLRADTRRRADRLGMRARAEVHVRQEHMHLRTPAALPGRSSGSGRSASPDDLGMQGRAHGWMPRKRAFAGKRMQREGPLHVRHVRGLHVRMQEQQMAGRQYPGAAAERSSFSSLMLSTPMLAAKTAGQRSRGAQQDDPGDPQSVWCDGSPSCDPLAADAGPWRPSATMTTRGERGYTLEVQTLNTTFRA